MTEIAVMLRDVEVAGRVLDVLVEGGRIRKIGPCGRLTAAGDAEVVQGRGGALLPGLHDHHLHLLSLAATRRSVDLSGLQGLEAVGAALRTRVPIAPDPAGWIRATGYHESIAGPLDRWVLDAMVPDRPLRVQHRSGAVWMVNSVGLRQLAEVLDDSADVERDERGDPTGLLWRYDDRLRARLPDSPPDLGWVGDRLRELGITGVTDATPDLDAAALGLLGEAVARGRLPAITVLGAPPGVALPAGITAGPRKIMIRDHDLSFGALTARIAEARSARQPVAIHCVTRESLALVVAALREHGSVPGDRIEHGAVIPREMFGALRELSLRVVTQPDFLRTRGEAYRSEVDRRDQDALYRYRSLLATGIPVAPSSDAPFGALDPWLVMRSAGERATAGGHRISPGERVGVRAVLDGYLSPPAAPGGAPRRLAVGAAADLVLLRVPLREALADPQASWVRRTFVSPASAAVRAGSPG